MKLTQRYTQVLQFCVLCSAIILTIISFYTLTPEIIKVRKNWSNDKPYPGAAFLDLKDKLKSLKIAGYLTNKDVSSEKNDGEFLMAQYALAPIVLDLGQTHTVNIISTTSKEALVAILQQHKLKPLYINKHGKTIAIKIK